MLDACPTCWITHTLESAGRAWLPLHSDPPPSCAETRDGKSLGSTAPVAPRSYATMTQPGSGVTAVAFLTLAVGALVSITVFWLMRFLSTVLDGRPTPPEIWSSLDDYPTRTPPPLDRHVGGRTALLALAAGALPRPVHSLRFSRYSIGHLSRVMLLLVLVTRMSLSTGCPSSSFDHIVNSEGALEFPLFHTDHQCVQQHLGRPMTTQSIVETDLPIDLIRNDSINDFLFLMPIKLGTPPVWNLVSVDTGSPLRFVQCEPCTLNCHDQQGAGAVFNPNKSQSFSRVGCSEPICRTVQSTLSLRSKGCMEKEDSCLYSATYGESSQYYSVGRLVTDTIAIGQFDKQGYSVPSFIFGCSLDTEYDQHEAGIFGLGAAPFSFFGQVAPLVGYKAFSYCFPSDVRKTGYLTIGDYNRVSSTSYTPMYRQGSQYALKLDKVVANGVTMVTNHSDMIVDSGSKWTLLSSVAFSQLDTVITKAMEPLQYARAHRRGSDYICFEDAQFRQPSTWPALPVVELSFDTGATLRLPPRNTFHFHTEFGLCTYFMRGDGVQVLGNTMTRSIGVTYDIQGDLFAFRNGDC
uniref:Uncharacterized protein n=1 Tax=Avena sativa TaxID=4498 RepID=A0ACD5WHF1_AVESA